MNILQVSKLIITKKNGRKDVYIERKGLEEREVSFRGR